MRKILGYLFGPLFLSAFGLVLIVFDPIQRISYYLGGYMAHKRSVDVLNWFLMRSLVVLGSWCRFRWNGVEVPSDRPVIVVSNHQSMFDIPPIFWHFRRHHVKFISKIELAKGVPSISFNLKVGGNAVIDRKDSRQSIPVLIGFARYIEENRYCAAIFPEGTRSRTGKPKAFNVTGLKVLMSKAPSAVIVPLTINHTWKIMRYGWFPMPVGIQPTWDVHPVIDPKGRNAEEVIAEAEQVIKAAVVIN